MLAVMCEKVEYEQQFVKHTVETLNTELSLLNKLHLCDSLLDMHVHAPERDLQVTSRGSLKFLDE